MDAVSQTARSPVSPAFTRQYWTFQISAWSAMAVLSFLSLTVWYNPGELAPALHTLVQSVLGVVVSHPLRSVATQAWSDSLIKRLAVNSVAVLLASLIWTALRIQTFTWLTGEVIPLTDLGGWIFASVIVFGAWSFCFHALRYSRLSLEQKRLATEAQNAALKAQAKAQRENFKRLETETLFRDAQLRMLKYQLNPHFFLNALNSVSSLVSKGDKDAAMGMLARIGDFLRVSLADPEEVAHTLDEELDALNTYLAIETVRFGDRLRTRFDIDEAARAVLLPSLLLQPLLENAIKHAVGTSLEPTTITITARRHDATMTLTVTDDGPGLSLSADDADVRQDGIGLMNVRQRLESAYGAACALTLKDSPDGGLAVEITLPVTAPQPA